MTIEHILVLGLGKVGSLVATLLQEGGFHVVGLDASATENAPFDTMTGDVTDEDFLTSIFDDYDTVVSCLPYHLNKKVVEIAFNCKLNYFDLTEDVPTTNYIRELAARDDCTTIMAPQCGLAPGFIGIVGASLARHFDDIRSIELRVGALPENPLGALGYAFNWSAEGVVNEYLNDCQVIRDGEIKNVPAMQELETIMVGGTKLEAFTTSGGLGTMCETFAGSVQNLDYKTMRYPGHMKLMRFYFQELLMKNNRELAGEILVNAKPPVNDDVVYVYAAVSGKKKSDLTEQAPLFREEFVHAYYPQLIAGKMWRSISWTTACSIVSVIELAAQGKLQNQGFIKQEEIPLHMFFDTHGGGYYRTSFAGGKADEHH